MNITQYAKSTQHVCICTTISIILILLFIISPLSYFFMTSLIGKIIILFLLGYTLYYNIILTNKVSSQFHIYMLDGTWCPMKTNVTCSYIFSLFLIILIFSILYRFKK